MFAILNVGDKVKIEKIVKQKNSKYKIILDSQEKIITHDEVILKNNLLHNKEITNEMFNKINLDNVYYDVYIKVVKYISTKMRSKKEIDNYLNKFNMEETDKKSIIIKLEEIGLINDEIFTKCFISDRFHLSSDGPLLIKKELLKHDIDEEVIDKYLNKLSNEDIISKLDKLIDKKVKLNHKYSNYLLKQRISKDLSNRGFEYNMILSRINLKLIEDDDLLKKEFNKLYNKYKVKLTSPKLELKVRQSLYQKGYKIEDINKLLDEIGE